MRTGPRAVRARAQRKAGLALRPAPPYNTPDPVLCVLWFGMACENAGLKMDLNWSMGLCVNLWAVYTASNLVS